MAKSSKRKKMHKSILTIHKEMRKSLVMDMIRESNKQLKKETKKK